MNTEKPPAIAAQLFRLANLAVMPGWLLMLLAPRSRWTERLVKSNTIPLGLSGMYGVMLVGAMRDTPGGAGSIANPTLESIGKLFQQGGYKGTFAGWVHYLAFDFIVGRSIFLDAQKRELPHWQLAPALVLTLMSGPLGFGYYQLLLRLRGEQ